MDPHKGLEMQTFDIFLWWKQAVTRTVELPFLDAMKITSLKVLW